MENIQHLSLTQKPSKSDGRGQGGEVDKDDGSEDLRVQSVCVVADVVTGTALEVPHHPTERIACTGQRVLPRLLWSFISCIGTQIKLTSILILHLFLYCFQDV